MTGDVTISAAAAAEIARDHDAAAEAIGDIAKDLPSISIDGGEGSADLMEILSRLTGGIAALAKANEGAASIMREVGKDYFASDSCAEQAFDKLSSSIEKSR